MVTWAQTFRRHACRWIGLTLATSVTKLAAALYPPHAGDFICLISYLNKANGLRTIEGRVRSDRVNIFQL